MHLPRNDPPHDAPEPPQRAPKELGTTIDPTYYVTTRKWYHEDWLIKCQICQYIIAHTLLDRSISSEMKATILDRIKREIRIPPPSPRINDESPQKPKRAHFPIIELGGGGEGVVLIFHLNCPRSILFSTIDPTYYVTTRKWYHEDWLIKCQICQYIIAHTLLDRSISSEMKATILDRIKREIRLPPNQ